MNKEKFKKKCQELIEYESKTLKNVEQFVEDKNKSLYEKGLKCCVFLTWNYYAKEAIFFERPNLMENYKCNIVAKICKKEDSMFDLELETIMLFFRLQYFTKEFL